MSKNKTKNRKNSAPASSCKSQHKKPESPGSERRQRETEKANATTVAKDEHMRARLEEKRKKLQARTIPLPTLKDISLTPREKEIALAIIGELWFEWAWYRDMVRMYRSHEPQLTRHEARVKARKWVMDKVVERRLVFNEDICNEEPTNFHLIMD